LGHSFSVYLTSAGWTQSGIGAALSTGTIASMASQVPAGALVDAMRDCGSDQLAANAGNHRRRAKAPSQACSPACWSTLKESVLNSLGRRCGGPNFGPKRTGTH
jgi:hypothetical protein